MPWRKAKYVGEPRRVSAICNDADVTMTKPSSASVITLASSHLSCGARASMKPSSRMGHLPHCLDEGITAIGITLEHVEAGTRRRQQHGITGFGQQGGSTHGVVHVG